MTPAQQQVRACLETLRFLRGIRCANCDDECASAPCRCFENMEAADSARAKLKEAKRARNIEKRALATTSTP